MNNGVYLGISAYVLWGLFPIYWKWLAHVPAIELICHRIVWSCIFLMGVLLLTRRFNRFRSGIGNLRVWSIYTVAAVLIGINWFTYIWAVNSGFIIETSLGYFINPLISVLLGVIFLKEKLRPWQWVAIFLAATGVIYLTVEYGTLPWVALVLAVSFAIYGLVKKTAPLNSIDGLTLETGILFLPAFLYLLHVESLSKGAFLHAGFPVDVLLVCAGVVTSVPLLLFSAAARRIPLSAVGIIQYISPTLTFLLGTLVFSEPFTKTQFIGYAFVWTALIIFAIDGYRKIRCIF